MNVVILGATGTFGTALTERLLSDTDCNMTLFSRHADDLEYNSSRVCAVSGDALNLEDLENVLKGQDVVYCAISGNKLPEVAENLVKCMSELHIKRLIFMGAVGIYDEIPDEMDGKDNVSNNPEQLPNREAVDIIESSNLNYTIVRPGFLREGSKDDFVLTIKGEMAKGYITTIPSLTNFAIKLIKDDTMYSRKSVSITREEG